ncbi:unnamed protein product, partial [Symbiodinium pilosum]
WTVAHGFSVAAEHAVPELCATRLPGPTEPSTPGLHISTGSSCATLWLHCTAESSTTRIHRTPQFATARIHSTNELATTRIHSTTQFATARIDSTPESATPRVHCSNESAATRIHSAAQSATPRVDCSNESASARIHSATKHGPAGIHDCTPARIHPATAAATTGLHSPTAGTRHAKYAGIFWPPKSTSTGLHCAAALAAAGFPGPPLATPRIHSSTASTTRVHGPTTPTSTRIFRATAAATSGLPEPPKHAQPAPYSLHGPSTGLPVPPTTRIYSQASASSPRIHCGRA